MLRACVQQEIQLQALPITHTHTHCLRHFILDSQDEIEQMMLSQLFSKLMDSTESSGQASHALASASASVPREVSGSTFHVAGGHNGSQGCTAACLPGLRGQHSKLRGAVSGRVP